MMKWFSVIEKVFGVIERLDDKMVQSLKKVAFLFHLCFLSSIFHREERKRLSLDRRFSPAQLSDRRAQVSGQWWLLQHPTPALSPGSGSSGNTVFVGFSPGVPELVFQSTLLLFICPIDFWSEVPCSFSSPWLGSTSLQAYLNQ